MIFGASSLNTVLVLGASLGLGACSGEASNVPLIFGQSESVGIVVSGSVPDQGGGITLGYQSRNIAVIPVVVREPDGRVVKNANGDAALIKGETNNNGHTGNDSLSTIGQFEVSAKAGGPEIALGKFFATGQAANVLADGFASKLAK